MLEVCCFSVEAAQAAWTVGADRIELCSDRELDGVTPQPSLLLSVRKLFGTHPRRSDGNTRHSTVPLGLDAPSSSPSPPALFVMLRSPPRHSMSAAFAHCHLALSSPSVRKVCEETCRAGTCGSWHCAAASLFCLTSADLFSLTDELLRAPQWGLLPLDDGMASIEGVVFGALRCTAKKHDEAEEEAEATEGGECHALWEVDLEAMRTVADAAKTVGISQVTFHRAFDFVNNFIPTVGLLSRMEQPKRSLLTSLSSSKLFHILATDCSVTRILSASPFCYWETPLDSEVGWALRTSPPTSKVEDHMPGVLQLIKHCCHSSDQGARIVVVLAGGVTAHVIRRLRETSPLKDALRQRQNQSVGTSLWLVEFHGSFLGTGNTLQPDVASIVDARDAIRSVAN